MATFLFSNQNLSTMKNIYKISAIVLFSFTIAITSCKKDETIIEGCTDSSAMNYLSNATSDDGSCVFAYKIAQGDWAIDTSCDSVTISISLLGFEETISISEMFSDSVEITGEENNVVSMDINGNEVLADIASDGTVTIQDNQTIEIDVTDADPIFGPLIGVIEVDITGSGKIETATNGDLTLNLAFDILSNPQTSSCAITFTK